MWRAPRNVIIVGKHSKMLHAIPPKQSTPVIRAIPGCACGKLNNPGNTVAVSAEARSFLIRADPIDAFFKRRVRRNGQFLRDELSKTHRPGYGGSD